MEVIRMTDQEFKKLSILIYEGYGIKMPVAKKVMLEGRLRKRLIITKMSSFTAYCNFLFSKEGMKNELIHMIDVVSTNKTDFFREPGHFNYMTDFLLLEFQKESRGKPLNIWSSASSSGEEAYTIAITIEEFYKQNKTFDYSVFCTDISSEVIKKGVQGIYDESRISNIPLNIKKKYFLKGKEGNNNKVRVVPELRKKMTFNRLNLMDDSYSVPYDFDVIFCRNVLIYFDKQVQERVINKLCNKLKKGGILFLGHSESIAGINVPLETISPTIYRKV